VDKVGQNLGTSRWWPAGGRWPRPPLGRLGGGDCGGTKQLQKKFFKKVTTKSNCAKMSTSSTHSKLTMKTKQATVTIDDQEWIVLDTDEPKDNKVFCTLTKPDSTIIWHTWVSINDIVGII
jgi:hypothetical protein